jgi:hypothetical protein
MSQTSKPDAGLAGLRRASRWREESASNVFSTLSAWEWFKRQHFRELIESGQLIPNRGRRGDLVAPGIDAVVEEILRREATGNTAALLRGKS